MSNAWEQTQVQAQEGYPGNTSNGALAVQAPEMPAAPSTSVRTAASEEGAGNIDKIRDILFGGQMRDYESRFQRLEQILLKESADLRDSNRKAIERIETYFKQELEALHQRLRSERDERSGALSNLSKDLKDAQESLSRRIADVDDQAVRCHHDLRDQLLQHGSDMTEQLEQKHREATALLEQRFLELRKDKTDKAALSSLFKEVAMRLNNEFSVPGLDH